MTQFSHRDQVMDLFDLLWFNNNRESKGNVVLDAGARNLELKEKFEAKGYKYIATDIKPDAEGVLKMDFNKLTFPDEYFDIVFCCHAFEHTETPIRTLKEFWRVLKKGGVLFMATPNPVKKQILEGDWDHLFVLNEWQIERLLKYTMFKKKLSVLEPYKDLEEFQWSLITVAEK